MTRAYRFIIFSKPQVIFAKSYDKYDSGNIVETVYPLASLGTLSSYVIHSGIGQCLKVRSSLMLSKLSVFRSDLTDT